MFQRACRFSLLGIYLAAGLLAGSLPHSDGCAHHLGHAHSAAPHEQFTSAPDACEHDGDCAICKFLGQRYLAAQADCSAQRAQGVAAAVVSCPRIEVEWPRSPHDPRGPPLG